MEKINMQRSLGPWQASSLVVGTIIGTGIFLKTATMTQQLGTMSLVLLAWIFSGVLSYAGALTYAELASHFPESGGEYAILKHTYGKIWSFLFGWVRFCIASPATIAAYAVGASTFCMVFLRGISAFEIKLLAVGFITLFSAINCLQLKWGARIQTLLTALKVILIIGLILGIFFFGHPADLSTAQQTFGLVKQDANLALSAGFASTMSFVKAFLLAMLAALWAFDGWNNLPMAGAEIKNPKRNIPIALGLGVLLVGGLYVLVNYSYFMVLTPAQIMQSHSNLYPEALPVATLAAQNFLGQAGVPILSVAFVISALGAMNGSILTSARVPFAMAQDGLFFQFFSRVPKESHVPVLSIVCQAVMSAIMAFSGSFDQLTDYVVVSSWFFYGLTTSSIFILRRKKSKSIQQSNNSQEFKVPLYPLLPIVFILVSFALTLNSLIAEPTNAIYGLAILAIGIPVYWYFTKRKYTT